MKPYRIPAIPFILTLLLWGCTQLGLAPADKFEDKLAYAYGTHTAVLQAATVALQSHELSKADAVQVLNLADQSRALLDAARAAAGTGDVTTANGRLVLATSILAQLQTYLRSKHGN